MQADSDRPEATDALQMEGGMARVLTKQLVTGVGQPLDLGRQAGEEMSGTVSCALFRRYRTRPVFFPPESTRGFRDQAAAG